LLHRDLHSFPTRRSSDLPIVLVRIAEKTSLLLGAHLIRLHRWWQRGGLNVDLVFLQESAASYQEPIREQLFASLREANIPEGLRSEEHTSELQSRFDLVC